MSDVDAAFRLRPLARLGVVLGWSLRRTVRARRFLLTGGLSVGLALGLTQLIAGFTQNPVYDWWVALDTWFLGVGIPLIALALVAGGFGEEVQDQTLVYLLVRPVSRTTAFLARYGGGAIAGATVGAAMAAAAVLFSPARVPFGTTLVVAAIAAFGVVTIGALYYALAALFRRGIVAGLIYTFVVEGLFQGIPGSASKLSIVHHIRSLFHEATDSVFGPLSPSIAHDIQKAAAHAESEGMPGLRAVDATWTTPAAALIVCTLVIVCSLGVGASVIRRRDFALKE